MIEIPEEDDTKLKNFAISYPNKEEKDNLSREERNLIRTLKENTGIVI